MGETSTDRGTGSPVRAARLVEVAAVIGSSFDVEVLAAAADADPLECLDALVEAQRAGVLTTTDTPERQRFVDAETHAEVLARIPPSDRVRLHARIADVIARVYADQLDAHIFELAGHWSAAAVGDYRPSATEWIARAAATALQDGQYAEAVRLFGRALEVGRDATSQDDRCRMLLDRALAAYRCSDLGVAMESCEQAARIAAARNRSDLLSEAALIVEPSLDPELNLRLRQLCLDALAGLPDDDRSLRLRVTARMADVCHYLGDRQAAAAACAALDRLLDAEADPSAVVVALHAQQLEASGPADVAKRGRLAEHLATVARQLGDSGQAAWAHLWLVDIVLQNGDLSRARLELDAAYRVGVDAADVLVRWQFLRAEATLAQAQARYEDAKRHADEAAALLSARGNPLGWMIWTGQQASIRYHTGFDEGFAQACGLLDEVPTTLPAAPVVHVACNVVTLLQIGRPQRAAALYQSLGPADRWQFPPHSTLFTYTYGLIAAIGLGRRDDVVHLRARLAEFRGHHVVASAGCVAYFGPVELWLGLASAFLGEDEAAVADLEYATAACRMNGAAGFHTQAQVELATMLLHVGGLDNTRRGRAVASEALERAELLGMAPFAARARALLGRADGAVPDVLTRRELEVAELVADALSNRAIAQRLHLSERTVANHVQHIFEKLGFANRGQIVAWIHDRRHE